MGQLKSYHRVWLSVHPARSEEWLRQCLREGFDVHHVDGDHGNDDPLNLVLIECRDHWLLHNGKRPISARRCGPLGPRKKTLADGHAAIEWRKTGLTWRAVGSKIGVTAHRAIALARQYEGHVATDSLK